MTTVLAMPPATGLTDEQRQEHAEAAKRRRTRERAMRMVEEQIDLLATLIGRLTVHVETYRGDVGPMVRERQELVIQMHRLVCWKERNERTINGT